MRCMLIGILCFMLCVSAPTATLASDDGKEEKPISVLSQTEEKPTSDSPQTEEKSTSDSTQTKEKPTSGLSLTVVVPRQNETKKPPVSEVEPAPKQDIPYLYPVSVWETRDDGRREIIKTYELGEGEKPEHISKEPFEREGWRFELTDITKKEMASFDTRDHTETVTVGTQTKDLEAVIKVLAPTIDFQSDDGYIGVLTLDISTIKVETAGTKKNSYTVSATREYPHLSSNDTSLVPKTITDKGKTLTLSGVNWKTHNSETIDYSQLPESYTAVATYTTTASSTSVTGYTTSAEYKGSLTRVAAGKTQYTAYFIGIPIVTPSINTSDANSNAVGETGKTEQNITGQEETDQMPDDMGIGKILEAMTKTTPETTAETEAKMTAEAEGETAIGAVSETDITTTTTESDITPISDKEQNKKPNDTLQTIIIVLAVTAINLGVGYFYLQKKKKEETKV